MAHSSGYSNGQPASDWLTKKSFEAAQGEYYAHLGAYGFPVEGKDPATGMKVWRLHLRIGVIDQVRAAEATGHGPWVKGPRRKGPTGSPETPDIKDAI